MTHWIDPIDSKFMAAVGWSEELLEAIELGWEPPCTSADLRKVRDDAMHAMARGLPDPHAYAELLDPALAAAIVEAVHGRTGGLWVADGPLVPVLRSLGLITIRDRELSGYGMAVRRELKGLEGE